MMRLERDKLKLHERHTLWWSKIKNATWQSQPGNQLNLVIKHSHGESQPSQQEIFRFPAASLPMQLSKISVGTLPTTMLCYAVQCDATHSLVSQNPLASFFFTAYLALAYTDISGIYSLHWFHRRKGLCRLNGSLPEKWQLN